MLPYNGYVIAETSLPLSKRKPFLNSMGYSLDGTFNNSINLIDNLIIEYSTIINNKMQINSLFENMMPKQIKIDAQSYISNN